MKNQLGSCSTVLQLPMTPVTKLLFVPSLLLMLVAVSEASLSGMVSAPSYARCMIKRYRHCYNLEQTCPSFCHNGCVVECVSCMPMCVGDSSPTLGYSISLPNPLTLLPLEFPKSHTRSLLNVYPSESDGNDSGSPPKSEGSNEKPSPSEQSGDDGDESEGSNKKPSPSEHSGDDDDESGGSNKKPSPPEDNNHDDESNKKPSPPEDSNHDEPEGSNKKPSPKSEGSNEKPSPPEQSGDDGGESEESNERPSPPEDSNDDGSNKKPSPPEDSNHDESEGSNKKPSPPEDNGRDKSEGSHKTPPPSNSDHPPSQTPPIYVTPPSTPSSSPSSHSPPTTTPSSPPWSTPSPTPPTTTPTSPSPPSQSTPSPTPPTTTPSSPSPTPPTTTPSSPSPSPPSQSTPSPTPPTTTPPSPSPQSSSTPPNTTASPSTPTPTPPTTPSNPSPPSTPTPSPHTPTPPTSSSPPPSTPSTSPKTARCKNKYYPRCYNTEHVCPSACPAGCEIDCATCKPVCKCDRPGAVCQDPRFIGGDGITFYFHGKKDHDFCLVSDPNLHINAHFIGKRNEKLTRDFTWVQSISIFFDKHQLFLGALKASTWDDSADRLSLAFDGEPLNFPGNEGSKWQSTSVPSVSITRISDSNNVVVEVEGLLKITAKVVPITEEDSRIHNYGITKDDCFAHLDLGFKFYSLSNEVDGVLGQTYRPGYVSRVNVGAKMAVMGGNKEFATSGLSSPDCAVARFRGGNGFEGAGYMGSLELPSMRCASGIDGEGVVCKR
ncbi:PREDICTED: proteoglycan 4-like [Populus euphratica]|uniref:Proteoglycan 4-like n=1 Tax=Populus euphratica TaxID=75702 RepID=A0AAJ6SXV7_POPEU|nr:PREDICTED: proteoglycan 4-like [Populus euphratica]